MQVWTSEPKNRPPPPNVSKYTVVVPTASMDRLRFGGSLRALETSSEAERANFILANSGRGVAAHRSPVQSALPKALRSSVFASSNTFLRESGRFLPARLM